WMWTPFSHTFSVSPTSEMWYVFHSPAGLHACSRGTIALYTAPHTLSASGFPCGSYTWISIPVNAGSPLFDPRSPTPLFPPGGTRNSSVSSKSRYIRVVRSHHPFPGFATRSSPSTAAHASGSPHVVHPVRSLPL